MAGKLSFSIAINLLTENFKRGTSSVKNGLRSMQMQVLTFAAALGAGGMGLSGFVTQLITVARETSRVTTALKNVSGGMGKFADNQRFLLDMAKKYGLEINALTGNYAKFTAASQVSGMSMENQRKIFESVSRACTAFGMSADDSNGVFLALSQMMSKGKISSEELRLQMGERLPIALQAMAKAAGVSVGELDKLMKQGKLMSKDVLPGFADALNEMIPNVDTDNIETSVNRLKNAFTKFTNGTGIQNAYKGIIDWLAGAMQSAGENIKNIVIGTVAVISGLIAKSIVGWWGAMASSAAGLEAVALRSNTKLIAATATRIAAEIALEEAKIAANNATGAAALAAKQRVIQAEKALIAASAAEQVAIGNVKDAELKVLDAKRLADVKTTAGALAAITRKRVAAEIELEVAKTGVITANSNQILAAQTRLAAAQTALAKLVTKEVSAQEAAKVATIQAASVKSAGWWSRACVTMRTAGAKLVVSLKAMWSAFAPMVVISAIVAIIGKFKAMYDEAKRIRNIFSDYKKESQISGYTQEVVTLKQQLKIMNDKKQSQENINGAQAQLQKMLGDEHASQEELNKLVAKRVELLKEAARADFHAKKVVESEEALRDIGSKTYNGKTIKEMAPGWGGARGDRKKEGDFKQKYGITSGIKELEFVFGDFKNDLNLYLGQSKIWKHSTGELEKSTVAANKILDNTPPGGGTPDDKKTALQKAEEEYANKLKEYANQRDNGALKEQEYNKAIDELNEATYKKIGGLLTPEKALQNETFTKAMLGTYNPRYDENKEKAAEELEKVEKEYRDSMALAKEKLDRGLLSQQGYNDAIVDAAVSAANSAIAIEGIGDAADGFIKKVQGIALDAIESPVLGKRDATFDYKKSDSDKISGELDIWKKYKDELEELKDEHKVLSQDLQDKLNNAIKNVDDLGDALNLSEIQEDIKQLSKDLDNGIYSGIKDSMSVIDSLVSSFKNLDEVFDPESEASEWEKLMAVWNALTNAVDSFMSICKMMESLAEITDRLTQARASETQEIQKSMGAKVAEATVDTTVTGTKVANSGIKITADNAEKNAVVANAGTEVVANTAKAGSAAAASVAGIPIVGLALAAAAVATIIGIFASLPKFATGGIVGGNSPSGDKILARLNSGELILNKGQQSKLSDAIDSQRSGSGGGVVVSGMSKVKGDDIYLSLSNHVKRTGKKSPWK